MTYYNIMKRTIGKYMIYHCIIYNYVHSMDRQKPKNSRSETKPKTSELGQTK